MQELPPEEQRPAVVRPPPLRLWPALHLQGVCSWVCLLCHLLMALQTVKAAEEAVEVQAEQLLQEQ